MHTNNNECQDTQIHCASDEISLFSFVLALLRYRWLVITFILAGAVIAGVFSKLTYVKFYKAESYVILKPSPKVTDADSVKLGDTLLGTYAIVLKTSQLLEKVALSKYDYVTDGGKESINLLKYYGVDDMNIVIQIIKGKLVPTFDKNGLILTLSYTAENPELAAQIINNIVSELDNYYKTQFAAVPLRNLEFVTKSLEAAKKELDDARNKFNIFITSNKQLQNISKENKYPACYLSKQVLQQLEQDVDLKTKTYNDLKESYEKLRLQVSENAPAITVFEKAIPPQDPIPCTYIKASEIGAFSGFVIAAAYVFLTNLTALLGLKTNPLKTILTELKKG